MTIRDERLIEGEKAVREEVAEFLAEVERYIGKKRGGSHTLKVVLDDQGYIELAIREHSGKRRIATRGK